MYWEEYNITLQVGDIVVSKLYQKNYRIVNIIDSGNNQYAILKGKVDGDYWLAKRIWSEVIAHNHTPICNFKPSKQLLRKHKFKKLLNSSV